MSNPWFKFYGAEYLSDPKIDQLNPLERSCWITLLSLANVGNKNGLVENLKVFTLLTKSGIYPLDSGEDQMGISDTYTDNLGVLEHFESLGMIERVDVYSYQVKNWVSRQETSLTEAERAKSYRDRKKIRHENVTGPVMNVTLEESRIDKNIYSAKAEIVETPINTKEPKEDTSPYEKALVWAEKRTGRKFVNRVKQYAALKKAKSASITDRQLMNRWGELEGEEFYKKNGLDWGMVVSSFDRK